MDVVTINNITKHNKWEFWKEICRLAANGDKSSRLNSCDFDMALINPANLVGRTFTALEYDKTFYISSVEVFPHILFVTLKNEGFTVELDFDIREDMFPKVVYTNQKTCFHKHVDIEWDGVGRNREYLRYCTKCYKHEMSKPLKVTLAFLLFGMTLILYQLAL
jgi:hypothetical protein